MTNKHKILNDPVYGFISLKHPLLLDLMDHPFVQRLRRISQLGLSHLVYPGAVHNRFHHAVGAMHLMQEAVDALRERGVEISEAEARGVCAAILLHDIGHGPFSHALEHSLVQGVGHEAISALMMTRINEAFHGELDLAIQIFNNHHPKAFLHQLVSSELDMDRLDYLSRDSFYSGVAEGKVGADRIIKMLNVVDGRLVVEEKGIYSIEKFVVARRLMYWQVYLHHTVLAAEYMLTRCLQRARDLALQGASVFATPALHVFLYERLDQARFLADADILERFSELDDSDVLAALKAWQHHPDRVLSTLSRAIVSRQLFHIELRAHPFTEAERAVALDRVQSVLGLSHEEARYFVIHDRVGSKPYQPGGIMIRFKDGRVQDFAQASDHLDANSLFRSVEKSFLGYPKSCRPR